MYQWVLVNMLYSIKVNVKSITLQISSRNFCYCLMGYLQQYYQSTFQSSFSTAIFQREVLFEIPNFAHWINIGQPRQQYIVITMRQLYILGPCLCIQRIVLVILEVVNYLLEPKFKTLFAIVKFLQMVQYRYSVKIDFMDEHKETHYVLQWSCIESVAQQYMLYVFCPYFSGDNKLKSFWHTQKQLITRQTLVFT